MKIAQELHNSNNNSNGFAQARSRQEKFLRQRGGSHLHFVLEMSSWKGGELEGEPLTKIMIILSRSLMDDILT